MAKTELRNKFLPVMFLFIFVVLGCNKYEEEICVTNSEYITFSARLSSDTKAAPTLQLSGYAGVLGFTKAGSNWSSIPLESFENNEFSFDGDQLAADTPIAWSSIKGAEDSPTTNLSVYVYAPEDILVKDNITASSNNVSFSYTVPGDVESQKDLLVAHNEIELEGASNLPVPLVFTHALSAVNFKTDEENVKSVKISGVKDSGTYVYGTGWKDLSGSAEYEIAYKDISDGNFTLMLMPQILPSGAEIVLTYNDGSSARTSLTGKEWKAGKMVTYTLKKKGSGSVVYFDLAAGNVVLDGTNYSGYVYVAGQLQSVTGSHNENNTYYVYQSSELNAIYNKFNTGYKDINDFNSSVECRIPNYPPVKINGELWSDYITNNTNVENIIEYWDDGKNIRVDGTDAPDEQHIGIAAVRDAYRTHTRNYIKVTGMDTKFNLTVDNIYSVIQQPVNSSQAFRSRSVGGISFIPSGNVQLTVNFTGDNRMGCLHIDNTTTDKIILEGTGSLTVADADFLTVKCVGDYKSDFGDSKGYISNFWNSAIGNNTNDETGEEVYKLHINSGVIFAGATKAEDCTAIGGGGNGLGQIFINGGTVTAVATTAGTAIGGGMGHTAHGGPGEVHISGGNIYAYNFATIWNIPSSAIGGGGSFKAVGSNGNVDISGGNIYAYSALGTAIGGGSSVENYGGDAQVNISGGNIIARSGMGAGIGGGSACSGKVNTKDYPLNGGSATITISGNPIIRTGSIGGGTTGDAGANIGSANINVNGGDIQAQFVMAAGAKSTPSFTMNGGIIRNSDVNDSDYIHIVDKGGAVYLEDGEFNMISGIIKGCNAQEGGAVYIEGSSTTKFTMAGGLIENCISENGGAVYLQGGNIELTGGNILHNLANNGNGGGICIQDGNFTMSGGTINNNSALSLNAGEGGKGGGVYISSTEAVNVNLISGIISGNTSAKLGGGICVEMSDSFNAQAQINVGVTGGAGLPAILGNHTLLQGGGLYVSGRKADMEIFSGSIFNNTTSGYVANPNVVNEGGMVKLYSNTATTSAKVTFNGNDGTEAPVTEEHLVVSATNSIVETVKRYNRDGYNLVGWHTRKDGNDAKGRRFYIVNGTVTVNTDSDITLYALWEKQN